MSQRDAVVAALAAEFEDRAPAAKLAPREGDAYRRALAVVALEYLALDRDEELVARLARLFERHHAVSHESEATERREFAALAVGYLESRSPFLPFDGENAAERPEAKGYVDRDLSRWPGARGRERAGRTDPLTAAAGADDIEDLPMRDVVGVLAIVAGIAALAGPRRTRPLAGFLYGLGLSRGHGASRRRLEVTLRRLFDERQSAHARIDAIIKLCAETLESFERVREGQRANAEHFDRRYTELEERIGERIDDLETALRPGAQS